MSRKSKITGSKKIEAIERYLCGEDSLHHLAAFLDVHPTTIKQWLQTYRSLGPNGLLNTSKNMVYTKNLKTVAVKDYLAGGGSLMELYKKYGIKGTYQLRNWILKYSSHDKLKSSETGGTPIMTKVRATT